MNTDNFTAWQIALQNRDNALYSMLGLALLLVGSYLFTYVNWIPPKWGKYIRLTYEVGGVLLYFGIVYVCAKG